MIFKRNWIALAPLMAVVLLLCGCSRGDADTETKSAEPADMATESLAVTERATEAQSADAEQNETVQETETQLFKETEESAAIEETETEDLGIAFPYELDGGKLTVSSLFQSTITNPDCGDEYSENIASLEIINDSGEYLEEAEFTVILSDGSEIPFATADIPAGKTVWAFATDNTSLEAGAVCSEILCTAAYQEEEPVMSGTLSYESDGTSITVTNLTEEELTNLTVGYHCLFNDIYFGGLVYSRQIDELPANSSTVIEADECYIGSAEVARIVQEE